MYEGKGYVPSHLYIYIIYIIYNYITIVCMYGRVRGTYHRDDIRARHSPGPEVHAGPVQAHRAIFESQQYTMERHVVAGYIFTI
jgi:hypothetical protein